MNLVWVFIKKSDGIMVPNDDGEIAPEDRFTVFQLKKIIKIYQVAFFHYISGD